MPSLREWLTRKQRETRRGRAEMLLAERAALWGAKQESRHLPGWWEWLNLLLWTRSRKRTPPQRRMLRAGTRRHLLQAAVLVLAAALFGWVLAEVYRGPVKADHLVRRRCATADIDGWTRSSRSWPPAAALGRPGPKLRALVAAESSSEKERLHASLALLPVDPEQVAFLERQLLEVGPDEALVIAGHLKETDHRRDVALRLRDLLQTERRPGRRFRAACALAFLDPDRDWARWSDEVALGLVKEHPGQRDEVVALSLYGSRLVLRSLQQKVLLDFDPRRPEIRASPGCRSRDGGLSGAAEASLWKARCDSILETEGTPYETLNEWFMARGREAADLLKVELDRLSPADPAARGNRPSGATPGPCGRALLQLEDWDSRRGSLDVSETHPGRPHLAFVAGRPEDPRLHILRSYLIHRFARVGVNPDVLLPHYAAEEDDSARRACLLSLGEFDRDQLPLAVREPLVDRLRQTYREIRTRESIPRWTGCSAPGGATANNSGEIDQDLATGKPEDSAMVRDGPSGAYPGRDHGPAVFTMGSPGTSQTAARRKRHTAGTSRGPLPSPPRR